MFTKKKDLIVKEVVDEEQSRALVIELGTNYVSNTTKTLESNNELFNENVKKYINATEIKIKVDEEVQELKQQIEEKKYKVKLNKEKFY